MRTGLGEDRADKKGCENRAAKEGCEDRADERRG